MASDSEASTTELQSILERLINSRNRDLSLFLPFLLGFTNTDPGRTRSGSDPNSTDPDHNSADHSSPDGQQRERIILINPWTQGMVVIEGTGLDSFFRNLPIKEGQPPASKSSVEAMPRVEIREGDDVECVICLEEFSIGGEIVKEMPCKHRFHGGCIEKWLGLHGSCPVCRFKMPVEGEDVEKKREEEREERGQRQRQFWVSFSFGNNGRRRTEEGDNDDVNQANSSDSGVHLASARDDNQTQDSELGN